MHDVTNIWRVPLIMEAQGAHTVICKYLGLSDANTLDLSIWRTTLADRWDSLSEVVNIAMVGKYTGLSDAYLSVIKSLQHACMGARLKLNLEWVEASLLEDETKREDPQKHADSWAKLRAAAGILVPGGFGTRGVEGKILAANFARTNKVPYLGICLGMQIAVVEFARSVLGLAGANSTEFDAATPYPAVVFMPEGSTTHKGGTMRLGARKTLLQTNDCVSARLYQASDGEINERHRHRYEVNPEMVPKLEAAGMQFVGRDDTGERMEILELTDNPPDHPYYVAAQFHPEFKSRPGKPSPLFLGFILAAGGKLDGFMSGVVQRAHSTTTPVCHSITPTRNATRAMQEEARGGDAMASSPTSSHQ